MAKKKAVVEEAVEEAVEETVETAPVSAGKNTATVSWKGNTRVYSKEEHGADFRDLAKQFADKVGGKVA